MILFLRWWDYSIFLLFGEYSYTGCGQDHQSLHRRQGIGDVRQVQLQKEANEGLGISITVSIAVIYYIIIAF